MGKTTYTTSLIRLASWTVVQGARYPDYNNPFMVDSNRYKNIVMPFWFTDLGIKRVEAILYNDDISRATSIVLDISIVRWSSTISLYTLTLASWVTTVVSTTTKTLQANDKLYVTVTSAPADCQSAFEVFFNYSNKETAGQFANNISVWFDQSMPKVPVWVIKEQAGDTDNTPLSYPWYGTNNCWFFLPISSYTLTPQRYDAIRTMKIVSSTWDQITDKTAVSLSCWWSTWIWWTYISWWASANISAMVYNSESWTHYAYIASRWMTNSTSLWNDTFRIQKYSFSTSTQTLTYSARTSAYKTMKTGRSWWGIFWMRIWSSTWSFSGKIITWTMLRQQTAIDSKIWWLLIFNNTLTLSNTFKRIGNTDASLYGVYWPWYIYEETSGGVTTAITCIAHVTDTTSVVAPYPDKIACLWKYDNTWAITAQYDLRIDTLWTAIFTMKWVTQYGSSVFVFWEFNPDPVWTPTAKRPFIIEYDQNWNYVIEHITYANASSDIVSVTVNANYVTIVLKWVADGKSVIIRTNKSTLAVEFNKVITWMDVYYAESTSYNRVMIQGYSTTNTGSCYWYLSVPWANNTWRQPTNNFTVENYTLNASPIYITWYYWIAFIVQVSTNPTYTQAIATQTLSWWMWVGFSKHTIFKSLL